MKEGFRIPSFARRIGRSLRDSHKGLLQNLLPKIVVNETTDFSKLRAGYKKVILEIGFGNGEHLANFALQNTESLCIGVEPYLNGVASLLKEVDKNRLENIRVYTDDVRKLIPHFPKSCFDKIFIICPDPWPKQKQKKRRLINSEFIKVLKPLAKEIIIATDHLDYAKWILKHIKESGEPLEHENLESYTRLPEDWILTKYQRRGIKHGSTIFYFSICS